MKKFIGVKQIKHYHFKNNRKIREYFRKIREYFAVLFGILNGNISAEINAYSYASNKGAYPTVTHQTS